MSSCAAWKSCSCCTADLQMSAAAVGGGGAALSGDGRGGGKDVWVPAGKKPCSLGVRCQNGQSAHFEEACHPLSHPNVERFSIAGAGQTSICANVACGGYLCKVAPLHSCWHTRSPLRACGVDMLIPHSCSTYLEITHTPKIPMLRSEAP